MLGRTCALLVLFFATTSLSACVTLVYHPLGAIRQPLAIRFADGNFKDFSLRLICEVGPLLTSHNANVLCGNLAAHFEEQGAEVLVGSNDSGEAGESGASTSEVQEAAQNPAPNKGTVQDSQSNKTASRNIRLTAEVSAKRIRHERHGWLGILFFYSLSLIPIVEEFTDEQRVVIRGDGGVVLADETFQMRFIEYTGLGYTALNAAANFFLRSDKEQLNDESAERQMTDDLRAQMSQLVLNAGLRQHVMMMEASQKMGSR